MQKGWNSSKDTTKKSSDSVKKMKIPKTFVPEKGLENKIEQLIEEPKTYKKEYKTKEDTELEEELKDLLKEFDYSPFWQECKSVYPKAKRLLTRTSYKQITNKKFKYEYWAKPIGGEENYLLTIFENKQRYAFSRIKDESIEKFCKKFEHQRKMVYPKSFLLTGLAVSASLATSYLFSSYPQGTFLKDLLSWMMPSMVTIPTILSIPSIVKYVRKRVGKGLEKYCIGMIIGNDKKALEAAFS